MSFDNRSAKSDGSPAGTSPEGGVAELSNKRRSKLCIAGELGAAGSCDMCSATVLRWLPDHRFEGKPPLPSATKPALSGLSALRPETVTRGPEGRPA